MIAPCDCQVVNKIYKPQRKTDVECMRHIMKDKYNNEFYLDSAVNEALQLGLRCKVFNVDHFISFGTPNDLKTFEYWQSCFSKWHAHPYELKLDRTIPEDKVSTIKSRYAQFDEQVL